MNRKDFRDLEWGVATSSYQIEGAYKKDGTAFKEYIYCSYQIIIFISGVQA